MKNNKSNVISLNMRRETWSPISGYSRQGLYVEFSSKGRIRFMIENKEVVLEFFDGIELVDRLTRCQQDLSREVQSP